MRSRLATHPLRLSVCAALVVVTMFSLHSEGITAKRGRSARPQAAKKPARPPSGMHVLDLATGKQRWFRANWMAVEWTEVNHKEALLVTSSDDARSVALIRAADGKTIWKWPGLKQPLSSSHIAGDRLYVTTGTQLRCALVATGRVIWTAEVKAKSAVLGVVAGKLLLTTGVSLQVVDAATGKQIREETLPKPSEYASASVTWGISGSLLVVGVCDGGVIARDIKSGDHWQQGLPYRQTGTLADLTLADDEWRWPRVVGVTDGSADVLAMYFREAGSAFGLNRATGNIIWQAAASDAIAVAGAIAVLERIEGRIGRIAGIDASTGAEKWQVDLVGPVDYESLLFYGGGISGKVVCIPCNDATLYALDTATGKKLWEWSSPYWIPGGVICTRSFCVFSDSGSPELERG